jgi:hypothetical protein
MLPLIPDYRQSQRLELHILMLRYNIVILRHTVKVYFIYGNAQSESSF